MKRTTIFACLLSLTLGTLEAQDPRFGRQTLWEPEESWAAQPPFFFKLWKTDRGTYRIVPEVQNGNFSGLLIVDGGETALDSFDRSCRDVLRSDRFQDLRGLKLRFTANPYATQQELLRHHEFPLPWGQIENAPVLRKATTEIVSISRGQSSSNYNVWDQNFQRLVPELLDRQIQEQKVKYFLTGQLELDLMAHPYLRFFGCDLHLKLSALRINFELYGERATAKLDRWIGTETHQNLYERLRLSRDLPEESAAFDAGVALGLEAAQENLRSSNLFKNGRLMRVFRGFFKEKEGKFSLRTLDANGLREAYSELPEVQPVLPELTQDFIESSGFSTIKERK